jgi:hypothetical protein
MIGGYPMLSILHVLAKLPDDTPVVIKERRGLVIKYCSDKYFTVEGVAALNACTAELLGGGQWFQLWRGEIVSINSPELQGGDVARIHRGPLVDQAS